MYSWTVHLSYVPVDIPLSHVVVTPSFHNLSHSQIDTDQTIVCDAQDLVFTATLKSENKNGNSLKLYLHSLNSYSLNYNSYW